jgi:hypothetical protein
MVPTSPYPNIAASYDLKIVGFRNPMSHFAPPIPRRMSHLAHIPSNSWRDRRVRFSKIVTIEVWLDSEIAHPGGLTHALQLRAKHDNDRVTRFGGRICAVFRHTFPAGGTWKNYSGKSCHLSKATFGGGTRRPTTWKNSRVVYPGRKRRNGSCWPPSTANARRTIQS